MNPYQSPQIANQYPRTQVNIERILLATALLALAFFASLGAYQVGYSSGYADGNNDRVGHYTIPAAGQPQK